MNIYIILSLITSLLISILFGWLYFKESKNIYADKTFLKLYAAISIVVLTGILLYLVDYRIVISIIATYLLIIFKIEHARAENLNMFNSFDGIVRDYEVSIKWLDNAILRNGILINENSKKVEYINETIRTYSNKYVYYVLFANGKKKLVQKGTLMYRKINEKFNKNVK
jgi:hypothetical protein